MTALLVAVAGGLGALARVEIAHALRARGHARWATRSVNLVGTICLALLATTRPSAQIAQIVAIGLLGGFTTFSTWMVEADTQRGAARWIEVALPLTIALAVAAIVTAIG